MRLALGLFVLCMQTASAAQPAPALSRELLDYLKRPEAQLHVLDGALLICKHAHPALDLEATRQSLKMLSADLKREAAGKSNVREQAAALARVLFENHHFMLPDKDTDEAFLLSDVLRNQRGNCLGLSVLCLALAEEVPLPLYGVPVPSRSSDSGHMFVRCDDGTARRNFDPVEQGAEHADEHYVREFKLNADDLRSGYVLGNAKKRDVLALLLNNLGGSYVEDHRAAEAVPLLEAALALRAQSTSTQSNLAAARLNLGDLVGAQAG